MTELEKAARQALEALESTRQPIYSLAPLNEAITALRRALEQQSAEEPVAVVSSVAGTGDKAVRIKWLSGFPQIGARLYTAPQPAAPLTGLDVYLDPNDDLKPKRYPKPAAQFAGSYGTIDESAAKRIATALGWKPKRTWVGLTDEESEDIWNRYCDEMGEASINDAPDIARAIESALRSKNT